MEKCKTKKPLTLKINLSHAICNSKNEDTFSHVICMLSFFFYIFMSCHTIGHSPIFICQLPIHIHILITILYIHLFIYIYIYIYTVMAKHISTLGKYDQRRLRKLICIVNPFDPLFKKITKI